MRSLLTLLLFVGLSPVVSGHEDPNATILSLDSLLVDVSEDQTLYFLHTMRPKETLYSAARHYQCSLADIYDANPELRDRLVQVDEVIRIPSSAFNIAPVSDGPRVYYVVKPKETLYRIARVHFGLSIEEVMSNNHLTAHSLDIGQKLLIGTLKPAAATSETIEVRTDSALISNSLDEMEGFELIEKKNIAYWLKEASPGSSMIVLHNTAPVNSMVEVINPMYGKSVMARVIGRIPDKAYPDDIDIILSRAVADALGAIDSRFYVRVRYLQHLQR